MTRILLFVRAENLMLRVPSRFRIEASAHSCSRREQICSFMKNLLFIHLCCNNEHTRRISNIDHEEFASMPRLSCCNQGNLKDCWEEDYCERFKRVSPFQGWLLFMWWLLVRGWRKGGQSFSHPQKATSRQALRLKIKNKKNNLKHIQ